MAWIKIPAEHHPFFLGVVPAAPDVETVRMFGSLAVMVNGNMSCGLFARSIMARLNQEDQKAVLLMDGAGPFDPMGNGRSMKDTVIFPEDVMNDARELRRWIERSIAFTRTLPKKTKAKAKKSSPTKATATKKTLMSKP
jgi:TfoX/Sxy family transcriptional regulator of competence genes